jgi:hypothetical protein
VLTATNMVLGLRVRRRESRWWNELQRQLDSAASSMERCETRVRIILWTALTLCSVLILPGLLPGLLGGLKAPRVFTATLVAAASLLGTLLLLEVGGVAVSVLCLALLAYIVVLACTSCCAALVRTRGHRYLRARRDMGCSRRPATPRSGEPEE